MFRSLFKPPASPDPVVLKSATDKIIGALLAASPQVTAHDEHMQSEGYVEIGKPTLVHKLSGRDESDLVDRVPPSTLHHWSLTANAHLTPEEARLEKDIARVINNGYQQFQTRISFANTLQEPGELRFVSNNDFAFTLPLATLHEPDIFMGLLKGNEEAFRQSVDQQCSIACTHRLRNDRQGTQLPQRQ